MQYLNFVDGKALSLRRSTRIAASFVRFTNCKLLRFAKITITSHLEFSFDASFSGFMGVDDTGVIHRLSDLPSRLC